MLGTPGRAGIVGLFIGNRAEDIRRETRTGVLTVKPDGIVNTVK